MPGKIVDPQVHEPKIWCGGGGGGGGGGRWNFFRFLSSLFSLERLSEG